MSENQKYAPWKRNKTINVIESVHCDEFLKLQSHKNVNE